MHNPASFLIQIEHTRKQITNPKFSQVPRSVGIFCSECGTKGIHLHKYNIQTKDISFINFKTLNFKENKTTAKILETEREGDICTSERAVA